MRILSRFHDYYDGARAWDNEPKPVWVRETQVIKLESDALRASLGWVWDAFDAMPSYTSYFRSSNKESCVLIAFCGKVYPVWVVQDLGSPPTTHYHDTVQANLEWRFKTKDIGEKKFRQAMETKRQTWMDRFPFSPWGQVNWEAQWLNRVDPAPWIAQATPVFMISGKLLTLNPSLKGYEFQRRFPPYDCYQELDMFLSNQLAQQVDPVPERSQILIRDSKGFDDKSFKSPVNERKLRRKTKE